MGIRRFTEWGKVKIQPKLQVDTERLGDIFERFLVPILLMFGVLYALLLTGILIAVTVRK